jgi:hypothetical protein
VPVGPSQERLLTMSRYFSINRPRWYNCSIMTAKGLERQASTALAPDKGTCGRYCRVLVECASWHPASRDVELNITAEDFRQSLTATDPPAGLTHALAGVCGTRKAIGRGRTNPLRGTKAPRAVGCTLICIARGDLGNAVSRNTNPRESGITRRNDPSKDFRSETPRMDGRVHCRRKIGGFERCSSLNDLDEGWLLHRGRITFT